MNRVLSGKAAIIENRTQLREHIYLARTKGVALIGAACVVNLRRDQLRDILRNLKPETDIEYKRVGGILISYEDFPTWAEKWN